jgi:hypothetical protein
MAWRALVLEESRCGVCLCACVSVRECEFFLFLCELLYWALPLYPTWAGSGSLLMRFCQTALALCVCAWMQVCMHVCAWKCVPALVRARMDLCVCVLMCVCV